MYIDEIVRNNVGNIYVRCKFEYRFRRTCRWMWPNEQLIRPMFDRRIIVLLLLSETFLVL